MSAIIRQAVIEDMPRLLEMAEAFFRTTVYANLTTFDPESATAMGESMLTADSGILLVADLDGDLIGMIGALLYPFYFNVKHLTGQEIVWWVDEEHRQSRVGIQLLDAVEARAVALGAESFTMMLLEGSPESDRLAKLYYRKGYFPNERGFVKLLRWQQQQAQ